MKYIIYVLFLFCISCATQTTCFEFCNQLEINKCEGYKGDPGLDGMYETEDDNYTCEQICEKVLDEREVQTYIGHMVVNKDCEYEQ